MRVGRKLLVLPMAICWSPAQTTTLLSAGLIIELYALETLICRYAADSPYSRLGLPGVVSTCHWRLRVILLLGCEQRAQAVPSIN